MSYYHSGVVQIKHLTEKGAMFSVQGSTKYSTQIDWSQAKRNLVMLRCSCPHYAGGEFCKHLWASLLAVDRASGVPPIPGTDQLRVLHEYEVDDTGSEVIDLDEYDDDDEDDTSGDNRAGASRYLPAVRRQVETRQASTKPTQAEWVRKLDWIRQQNSEPDASVPRNYAGQARGTREGWYAISIPTTLKHGMLAIEFFTRERRQDGSIGALKHQRVTKSELGLYSEVLDREIMMMLFLGLERTNQYISYGGYEREGTYGQAFVTPALQRDLIPRLARTGRVLLSNWAYGEPEPTPIAFDDGEPWRLELTLNKSQDDYKFGGRLKRGEEKRDIKDAKLVLRSGLVVFGDRIGWLDADTHFGWMRSLREEANNLWVPREQGHSLVEALVKEPFCPPVDWPEELKWKNASVEPKPTVVISSPSARSTTRGFLLRVDVEYGGKRISTLEPSSHIPDRDAQTLYLRDFGKEQALINKLGALGLTLSSVVER